MQVEAFKGDLEGLVDEAYLTQLKKQFELIDNLVFDFRFNELTCHLNNLWFFIEDMKLKELSTDMQKLDSDKYHAQIRPHI